MHHEHHHYGPTGGAAARFSEAFITLFLSVSVRSAASSCKIDPRSHRPTGSIVGKREVHNPALRAMQGFFVPCHAREGGREHVNIARAFVRFPILEDRREEGEITGLHIHSMGR